MKVVSLFLLLFLPFSAYATQELAITFLPQKAKISIEHSTRQPNTSICNVITFSPAAISIRPSIDLSIGPVGLFLGNSTFLGQDWWSSTVSYGDVSLSYLQGSHRKTAFLFLYRNWKLLFSKNERHRQSVFHLERGDEVQLSKEVFASHIKLNFSAIYGSGQRFHLSQALQLDFGELTLRLRNFGTTWMQERMLKVSAKSDLIRLSLEIQSSLGYKAVWGGSSQMYRNSNTVSCKVILKNIVIDFETKTSFESDAAGEKTTKQTYLLQIGACTFRWDIRDGFRVGFTLKQASLFFGWNYFLCSFRFSDAPLQIDLQFTRQSKLVCTCRYNFTSDRYI